MFVLVLLEILLLERYVWKETGPANLYLDILEEMIDLVITREVDTLFDAHGNLLLLKSLLHFRQDGAPSHYFRLARQKDGNLMTTKITGFKSLRIFLFL